MTVEQMRKTKKPIVNDDRLHTAMSELRVMAKNQTPKGLAQSAQITYNLVHEISSIHNHKTNVSLYLNILER
jgi:hypothetical protein